MPKEAVYGSEAPFEPDGPGVSVVEVVWNREQGFTQVVSKAVRRIDHGPLVESPEPGAIHYTDGFYVNLDRKGINDLIRNLRRARDQAFGRDE